jgi:hypothetical protein
MTSSATTRWAAGAAALAAVSALTLATPAAQAAPAAPAAQAAPAIRSASVAVPTPVPNGVLMSYLVNTRPDPGQVRRAEAAVRAAGGSVVQVWPQIGVVVAHSRSAAFRARVLTAKGHPVQSVGATRTVAVTEGTPSARGRTVAAQRRPAAQRTAVRLGQDSMRSSYVGAARQVRADPREHEQTDMPLIKAPQAHRVTDGSRRVVVGVLDSGVESTHPDLAANMDTADAVSCVDAGRPDTSPGAAEPTTSGHGTHVAGTIAAARNGIGVVGVAPNVRLASVKVVNDDGFIYPEYAVCGFMWAGLHHFDVTNNSYYVDPWRYYCDNDPDQAAAKEAVRRAVLWSERQGVVSAAAAGNENQDLAHKTTDATSPDDSRPVTRRVGRGCQDIPTELPGVATTSATTDTGAKASFSNFGVGVVDVAAPGVRVLSTYPGGGYARLSGTSMASPHAAGVLALLKSAHRHARPAQLLAMLRAQADDTTCPTDPRCTGRRADNAFFGAGIVDALNAVR